MFKPQWIVEPLSVATIWGAASNQVNIVPIVSNGFKSIIEIHYHDMIMLWLLWAPIRNPYLKII